MAPRCPLVLGHAPSDLSGAGPASTSHGHVADEFGFYELRVATTPSLPFADGRPAHVVELQAAQLAAASDAELAEDVA